MLQVHGVAATSAWSTRPLCAGTGGRGLRRRRAAAHTIAVLSPAYSTSALSEAEWRRAFADDPSGELRLLIPVRIADCEPPGLLRARVYIDLIDADEDTARERLLEGVARPGPRNTTADFPGRAAATTTAGTRPPPFPGTDPPVPHPPGRGRDPGAPVTRQNPPQHRASTPEIRNPRRAGMMAGVTGAVAAAAVVVVALMTSANPPARSATPPATPGGAAPAMPATTPSAPPSAPPADHLRTIDLPPGSSPIDIAADSDGGAWFTEAGRNTIGHIGADGQTVREFDRTDTVPVLQPFAITAGPDGGAWFTEGVPIGYSSPSGDRIGHITRDGVITTRTILTDAGAIGIALGPGGTVWFIEQRLDRIGRLDPDGSIDEFPVGASSQPDQITTGPDGNMWFTEFNTDRIGRMTPDGRPLPDIDVSAGGRGPAGIATHGTEVWFTAAIGNRIGRIDPTSGTVTGWTDVPTATGFSPAYLASDTSRGGVWFTELADDAIAYVSDGATSTIGPRYPFPDAAEPTGIDVGTDGTVWFTERRSNRIGRLGTT